MIAALDSTPLATPIGGIRRYVAELHQALVTEFPADTFLLMSDRDRGLTGLHRKWWLHGLPSALKQSKVDLFHGTDFAVPYRRSAPAVMTIHDLSPWRFPQETSPRVRRRTPWLLRLGLAEAVITPSEAIRREAIERFRLTPERVHAIPLGVGEEFRPGPLDVRRGGEEDVRAPYFLAVGMGAGRKNLETVARAHGGLDLQTELVITGVERPNHGVTRYVTASDGPPKGGQPELSLGQLRLSRLYAQATALLYPSVYEGFGLPLLEAMACGTPVLASNDPALVETAGGAALHLDPHDVRGWTEAMRALLTQPELHQRLRAAGLERAAQFSWRRTAQLTREVYEDVLRRRR